MVSELSIVPFPRSLDEYILCLCRVAGRDKIFSSSASSSYLHNSNIVSIIVNNDNNNYCMMHSYINYNYYYY